MSSHLRRWTILCTLVVVLVVSAGCLGDGGQQSLPDAEAVSESLSSVDAIDATITAEIQQGNDTTTLTMDVVQQTRTREFRATVVQESPDANYRMVSNGSTISVYNRSTNTVTRVRIAGIQSPWNDSVDSVSGIFGALQQSSGDESVSISPLPMVPGGGSATGTTAGIGSTPAMGNVSLTYRGTESVHGREAHVVDITPISNRSVVTNGTIWFDAERSLPIKSVYEMSVGGHHRQVTRTYQNLTYNPSIPEGAFTFEAPPNATFSDRSESVSVYQSRSSLAAATEFSVPEPTVPDDYGFAQASTAADGDVRVMAMQYSNGEGTIVLLKQRGISRNGSTGGESVTVAGRAGTFRTVQGGSQLSWWCGETRYAVEAALTKSELRAIGESVVCE